MKYRVSFMLYFIVSTSVVANMEPVNDYKQPVKRNKKVIGTFNNKIDIDRMMTRSQKKKKDEEEKEEREIHNKTINDILQYDNAKEYKHFPSPFKTYVKKN
jgi:hypothetical protein